MSGFPSEVVLQPGNELKPVMVQNNDAPILGTKIAQPPAKKRKRR